MGIWALTPSHGSFSKFMDLSSLPHLLGQSVLICETWVGLPVTSEALSSGTLCSSPPPFPRDVSLSAIASPVFWPPTISWEENE